MPSPSYSSNSLPPLPRYTATGILSLDMKREWTEGKLYLRTDMGFAVLWVRSRPVLMTIEGDEVC
jgi:hypothetical protein